MNIKKILKEEILKESFEEEDLEKMSIVDTLLYYGRRGDLSVISIPVIQDTKLKWIFNQLLLMIDELRVNGIDTNDFLNVLNWGYKPNGNLGMFDIGYGDCFNQFEKEPVELDLNEDDLLTKIKSKLQVGDSKYLGSGCFGHAHDIGNNRVLKITKDKTEAVNSQKIIGKNLEHIAIVYDVKKFLQREDEYYYTIILEKLKTDPTFENSFKELKKLFDDHRNRHLDPNIISQFKDERIKGFLGDMITLGYSETWNKWREEIRDDNHNDFNDISEIAEWIKDSVTNKNNIYNDVPDYITNLVKKLTN